MATYSRSSSYSSDEPSQRDFYLADLSSSDEDVEALLAGGADVSDLITAGVLEDDNQPEGLETAESDRKKDSEEQTFLTPEEFQAEMEIGYRLLRRDYSNASSQPN